MQVADALNAQIAFTLFDAWLNAIEGRRGCPRRCGKGGVESPLIDAAFQAFNHYVKTKEAEHGALLASIGAQLSTTAPRNTGAAYNAHGYPVATTQDIAPFLALNIMA